MLSAYRDAYGHQLYDYLKNRSQGLEIVERDDGFIQANLGPRTYLSEYKNWRPDEKAAMRYVTRRVLDIGCGGGRHSLHLQKKGFQVLGVDVSPLAIKACKLRGLKSARVMSVGQLGPRLGKFDTILMLGNGFGLFGSPLRARALLKGFLKMTIPAQESSRRVWTLTRREIRFICTTTNSTRDGGERLVRLESGLGTRNTPPLGLTICLCQERR